MSIVYNIHNNNKNFYIVLNLRRKSTFYLGEALRKKHVSKIFHPFELKLFNIEEMRIIKTKCYLLADVKVKAYEGNFVFPHIN